MYLAGRLPREDNKHSFLSIRRMLQYVSFRKPVITILNLCLFVIISSNVLVAQKVTCSLGYFPRQYLNLAGLTPCWAQKASCDKLLASHSFTSLRILRAKLLRVCFMRQSTEPWRSITRCRWPDAYLFSHHLSTVKKGLYYLMIFKNSSFSKRLSRSMFRPIKQQKRPLQYEAAVSDLS